jgi:predicted Zn finger-like uncharacterized protein
MITKCVTCDGMMRVDEDRIPPGGSVRVRCPHCKGIVTVPSPLAAAAPDDDFDARPLDHSGVYAVGTMSAPAPSGSGEHAAGASHDFTFPDDAFQRMRGKGDRNQEPPPVPSPASWKKRLIIWAAASFAVVAMFALLVNIILPGPTKGKAFTGVSSEDLTTGGSAAGAKKDPSAH